MKKRNLFLSLLLVFSGNLLSAQSSETTKKYIAQFKDIAIAEEIRTGVPAAITLAQGIHETGAGTSQLVISSNNHFGIKCKSEWTGARVYHDDDAKGECFRKYDDPQQSYKDHSDFLKNRPYYAELFKLEPTDYKAWATGLKKCGYATNPKYAHILIKIIEQYNLQTYTLIALGEKSPEEGNPSWASKTGDDQPAESDVMITNPVVRKTIVNYPSGVFRINDTKVIFVLQGTAYLKIADEYDLSLSRLFEFNDRKPADISMKDELIYLQRKRKNGSVSIHVVQQGETPYDIAQAEGIRLENLLEYNFLQPGMLPLEGEQLSLQGKASAMPRLEKNKVTVHDNLNDATVIKDQTSVLNNIMHTVQPKETVYAIARKYEVSVDELIRWNELMNTDLRTGQRLRINK